MTSDTGKSCPIELRRICFIRAEDEKEIVLISNELDSEALAIMDLYKQYWQIEQYISSKIDHELLGGAFSKLEPDKPNTNQQLELEYA